MIGHSPVTQQNHIDVRRRNNITEYGPAAGRPIVFAHGFGCSQEAWRNVLPFFTDEYRVIAFDHVGAGGSDPAAYDRGKYDTIDGYAADVLDILNELDLHDVVYVGHSVSAMVGVVASVHAPERFGALVLVGPSPRYTDDGDYRGGFSQADIDGLIEALDANYLGWSNAMAPVIIGNPGRPELGDELTASFCRVDPTVARQFARVTFLSDNRRDLPKVSVPTLVLQAADDVIAPTQVGEYVHEHIPGSELRMLSAHGHVPNLSEPAEVAAEIRDFLG
jgi:sigma-B regulation protein RsbQ